MRIIMKNSFFLTYILILIFTSCQSQRKRIQKQLENNPPNIILVMADDLGWGDTGFNGNQLIQTPNLDKMARTGLVFNRFYASSPVCSPTRGSCLSGRHPFRYGIFSANVGQIKPEEILISEVLKEKGYLTGHFGKWHLGTLSKNIKDSNRGGIDNQEHYAPPQKHGFDVCFSTEAKVPTFNPMLTPIGWQGNSDPGKPFGTYYWNEHGKIVTENLEGDDSKIIMDRAVPFIENAILNGKPFFAVIWFHTPHLPVLADSLHRAMYSGFSNDEQNYFACITAMDEQIGRLRSVLENLKATKNTMIWFTSDNGPEGKEQNQNYPGSAGIFKGRKRSLYEGGIRVPGILYWPLLIEEGRKTDIPCSTLDYFPTIVDILGYPGKDQVAPVDGTSLLPLIYGEMKHRSVPICFESGKQLAIMNTQYKIYSNDGGKSFELFDLLKDPEESTNLLDEYPDIVIELSGFLKSWQESCQQSLVGGDY